MKIPKYVIDIMKRSQYEFDRCTKDVNYGAGYTIRIKKGRPYQRIDTLKGEVERLCKWANRIVPETAFLLYIPNETHYTQQYAIVSIFDPVMYAISKYMPENKE